MHGFALNSAVYCLLLMSDPCLSSPFLYQVHVLFARTCLTLRGHYIPGPGNAPDFFHSFMDGLDFSKPAVVLVVVIQNTVPIDLRTHRASAPTEKTYEIRSMRDALHGP